MERLWCDYKYTAQMKDKLKGAHGCVHCITLLANLQPCNQFLPFCQVLAVVFTEMQINVGFT